VPPLDNQEFEAPIPEAVRRQSRRADEIARSIGSVVPGEETPPEPPVVEPPAEPPAEPETPPEPAAPPETDWEQRYRTLQGKYDSEVPQMRNEMRQLRNLIGEMQAPPAPPAPATTATVIPDEDVEAYGGDLIAAARRWARSEMESELQQLRSEVAGLKGGQQQLTAQTAHQQVVAALNADPELAGVWEDVNRDQEFLSWLDLRDPFSGEVRGHLLGQAFDRGDSSRVRAFFKSFIAEHTATTRPPAPTPPTPPAAETGRPTLESLAAPGRASGTGPTGGAPAEKRVWTRNQITAFYRDCSTGKYDHREADRIRTEEDIFAAGREGRIR
jgi:hypothetical protein